MASRRWLVGALSLHRQSLFVPNAFQLPGTLAHPNVDLPNIIRNPPTSHVIAGFPFINPFHHCGARNLSSRPPKSSDEEVVEDEDEDDDEYEGDSSKEEDADFRASVSRRVVQSGKSEAEKTEEAAEIGYKVIGPLDPSESPFKLWEPFFAVVQIGSHQFKVCNGDSIFTERLKYCEVNDKLILSKVLMLGSKNQTIIGRPVLPDAIVQAVVEEHALDAKVIIFKKKRRKNYRRTKGHRQELTKLRITDIQGIDKVESTPIVA